MNEKFEKIESLSMIYNLLAMSKSVEFLHYDIRIPKLKGPTNTN